MNCATWEKLIYTFREISESQQREVRQHLDTCESCRKLFSEINVMFKLIEKTGQVRQTLVPSNQLTKKVMNEIAGLSKSETKGARVFRLFDSPISRFALAAVSCGIMILFFVEVMAPDMASGKIRGPISSLQGVIIKTEDFRKAFTRPRKTKSLFADCKSALTNQVDPNCVKEKIKAVNF